MSKEELVSILADGKYHSGEALGEALGISRSAAWKQVKKLNAFGLDIESVKGLGYRVKGGVDLISVDNIREQIAVSGGRICYSHYTLLPSTNSELMSRAGEGAAFHQNAITCDIQTDGRGRRGREWVSPYAKNIYLSLGWKFGGGASVLEGLSLAVGVAVARALKQQGVNGVALKWPNDVLVDGRKLAGILLEMTGDPSGLCNVVIGVGINVHMKGEALGIDQPWVSCDELCGQLVSREQLILSLLSELELMLLDYESKGFASYRDDWLLMHAYQGLKITVSTGSNVYVGEAVGVDATGALQLKTTTGVKLFHGGEVSVRG